MPKAMLTISSKNYSSWSLRGWLLARFSGIDFEEVVVPPDDADARKELLLLSPSILVPCLTHDGVRVWDTLAIAEYLNELRPRAGLLPAERAARVRAGRLPVDAVLRLRCLPVHGHRDPDRADRAQAAPADPGLSGTGLIVNRGTLLGARR